MYQEEWIISGTPGTIKIITAQDGSSPVMFAIIFIIIFHYLFYCKSPKIAIKRNVFLIFFWNLP